MPLRPGELAPLDLLIIDDHGPRGLTGRAARSLRHHPGSAVLRALTLVVSSAEP